MTSELLNYSAVLNELKTKIRQSRFKAISLVNLELLHAYWEIGNTILQQMNYDGWGTKVVERLGYDLRQEFPEFKGLSPRNFNYMRAFAEAYPDFPHLNPGEKSPKNGREKCALLTFHKVENQLNERQMPILQAPLAKLSWYHHITLLDKIKDPEIRQFYIKETIRNGWSRNVMVHQIESGLHLRQGNLDSNFEVTLPPDNSDLVHQIFKDPYNFDFLQLTQEAHERDLQNALIQHITRFLLELGEGFAFLGHRYKLRAGTKEFEVDMLFYHTRLRRYIVIELKVGDFEAEFVGKMNLYLSITDDILKGPLDESSIGLILCKTKDKAIVEYALRDTNKPIGISQYKITDLLPDNIKGELPSIEELEQKLNEELASSNRLLTIKNEMKQTKKTTPKVRKPKNAKEKNKKQKRLIHPVQSIPRGKSQSA